MAKLLLNSTGGQAQELHLQSGLIRVGRNSANDIQIEHPSVSSFHCEITCAGDALIVKDLGSTNGTFIESRAIQEGSLAHGQRLQLGLVEMILEAAEAPAPRAAAAPVQAITQAAQAPLAEKPRLAVRLPQPAAAAPPSLLPEPEMPMEMAAPAPPPVVVAATEPGGLCKYHPRTPARWKCGGCHQLYCDLCVAARPGVASNKKFCRSCGGECYAVSVHLAIPEMMAKSFFAQLPGIFAYPFKKNGWMMVIIGTILFAVLGFFARIAFSGGVRIISLSLWAFVFGTGYFLAYMQRIMTSSGYAEEEMPGWPDVTDFGSDVVLPMLLFAGTFLACIAPGLTCLIFGSDTVKEAAIPLFVLGAFYFPMAVLAVGMTDNIFSLNPLVIIPSIAKVFVHYLVATVFLAVLFGVYKLSRGLVESVGIPVISSLVISFLSLYFTTLQMRILGILYFTNKDRLGWFSRRT